MIYCIQDDGFDFQRLDLMLDDIIDDRPEHIPEEDILDFCQSNSAMAEWWPVPQACFFAETDGAQIPDISKWIDASLTFSPRAYRLLGEALKSCGEFLPVKVNGEIFYIFNCLQLGKVNESLSEREYYEGEEIGIKKIVFHSDDVAGKLVFKTSFNSCVEIYCGERFRSLVYDFGLTGVMFVNI